jgi:hypothetical protein
MEFDAGHKATGDASGDNSITGTPAGTILKTVYVMQKESYFCSCWQLFYLPGIFTTVEHSLGK